jgi:DNA-binding transcriptional MerR regulator
MPPGSRRDAVRASTRTLQSSQVDDNVNFHSIVARAFPPAGAMTQHMLYTITDLAREFDVTPRAIRFYEDQGLLAPSREGANGLRRVYSARDRTRLKLTLRGKRLGFTLSEIRALLDLYDSPTGTATQLKAFVDTIAAHREVLERQRDDIDTTLAELAAYEEQGRALLAAGVEKRTRKPKAA